MKTCQIIPLTLALLSLAATGIEIPVKMAALIEDPPSISDHHSVTHKFDARSVILEGTDFIALITLSANADEDKATYQFRTYSKIFKLEVSGSGELYENYYKVRNPNLEKQGVSVIDKGSKIIIDAGLVKVTWSAGNYIYLDKGVSVEVGDEPVYIQKIKEG